MSKLTLNLTPPQAAMISLKAHNKAVVAGYGFGKSHTMGVGAVLDAIKYRSIPDSIIGVYEPTFDKIDKIAAPAVKRILDIANFKYRYNKSTKEFKIDGCANIHLFSMRHPETIVGYQLCTAHIDEIDTLKEKDAKLAYSNISARTRQPLPGGHLNSRNIYTTPEGFKFVYNTWEKDSPEGSKRENTEGKYRETFFEKESQDDKGNKTLQSFGMIQANTASNPFLPEDYIAQLSSMYPSHQLDAYINGDFVPMTEGRVYPSFDRHKCVSNESVQEDDTLYIGCDFNIRKMAACVAVNRGDTWHIVDEFHSLYDVRDMIRHIQEKYGNHSITMYPDVSGSAERPGSGSYTELHMLRDAGFYVSEHFFKKSNPRIKDRVMCVDAALEKGRLFIKNSCTETIRCLEQQTYDTKGLPDKDNDLDHMCDAVGYFAHQELSIIRPVFEVDWDFGIG